MSNDIKIKKLKEDIFKMVKKYYQLSFNSQQKFIPGKTKINYAGRVFDEKELINLVDSSLEFWLTEGRFAENFRRELSRFLDINYCILTNSGSSANLLAITALTSKSIEKRRRLLPGDEIITIAAGFPTTIYPIIQNNAVPVFIDIELETYNIDASKLINGLSAKTKAVILAHTLGNPFDIEKVKEFCLENKLWLIEDNCDALVSKYVGIAEGEE